MAGKQLVWIWREEITLFYDQTFPRVYSPLSLGLPDGSSG